MNKGVTITSRKNDQTYKESSRVPGPGSYELDFRNKKNYGNVRIGSGTRDSQNKEHMLTPGPGAYEPGVDGIRNKEPAIRMGTSQRRPLSANVKNPGPGSYEIPSRMFEGPKVIVFVVLMFISKFISSVCMETKKTFIKKLLRYQDLVAIL